MIPAEVSTPPDNVTLRIARGGLTLPVMRVVVGGVASRHNLPLERLDDIQLAIETLLAEEPGEGSDLTLGVSMGQGRLSVRLDGLTNHSLKAALLASDPFQPCPGCLLDVRLLLDSLVDEYHLVEAEGGRFAVEMEKQVS